MPQLEMKLPQVPDVPWADVQHTFGGQWLPDVDPALIGAENFSTLKNLRYKDKSLEGVGGYTYIRSRKTSGLLRRWLYCYVSL